VDRSDNNGERECRSCGSAGSTGSPRCGEKGIVSKFAAIDKALNNALCNLRKPWLTVGSRVITQAGSFAFLTLACVAILFHQKKARWLLPYLLTAEILQLPAVIPLRCLIKRKRPRPADSALYLLAWNRYSFPSLHASRMFVFAMIFGLYDPISYFLMIPAALVVSFTRLVLEKHYLSDILVGAGIGSLVGATAVQVMRCIT
jgi:undecaprenyl-diphosphatase